MKKKQKYEEEYVQINGTAHYLLHYRAKPENPLLLFIHGGPGTTEAMMAYLVEEYEERNYNIVYYDQRGTGKTYLKNPKAKPDTATLKEDLFEIVLYLEKRYQKEKIGILGHSWGSVLGSMFALEHPEHTLCYIGCGQVVNFFENEAVGYQKVKEAVEQSCSAKDKKRLEKIGNYPLPAFDMKSFRKMGQVRKLQEKYHLAAGVDKNMLRIIKNSPIMGMKDMLPLMIGMIVNRQVMKELVTFDLRDMGTEYKVPVYYVLGEKDQQTPVEISIRYFNEIQAPDKNLYLVKNAGHLVMLDNMDDYRKIVCAIFHDLRNGNRAKQKRDEKS